MLTGRKVWVANAEIADVVIVFAATRALRVDTAALLGTPGQGLSDRDMGARRPGLMQGDPPAAHRGVAWRIFLGTLSLYVLTAGGSLTSTDATVMFDLTRSLVEQRSIALSGNLLGLEANRGVDGRYYSQYGIGQSLYNIPFYAAGVTAQHALGRPLGKPDTLPKAVVSLGNTVAAAAAVTMIWLLGFRVSGSGRTAAIACISVALASPVWPYAKFGFAVPLTTLVLSGAAYLVRAASERGSVRDAAGAGAVLAAGWLTRHEIALVLVPFALVLWWEGTRRQIAPRRRAAQIGAFLACAAVGGGLWAAYNLVRFGRPFYVGYQPQFGIEGYAAFLISPAGALLLFCPVALAWFGAVGSRRLSGADRLLLLGPFVVSFVFYGALEDWAGGRSYGPRYLVPSLVLLAPALAVALNSMSRSRHRAVLGLLLVSTVVQLPAVLVDYSRVSVEWARSVSPSVLRERHWRLDASPILLNTQAALRAVPENFRWLSGTQPLPPRPTATGAADREFAQQFRFSVDFWWAYLVYLGAIGRVASLAVAASLLGLALTLGRSAWRTAARLEAPPATA